MGGPGSGRRKGGGKLHPGTNKRESIFKKLSQLDQGKALAIGAAVKKMKMAKKEKNMWSGPTGADRARARRKSAKKRAGSKLA